MNILGLAAAMPMLLLVAADLDDDTRKNFEKIADSVAMSQTCRQHDFVVDDAGINDWKTRAVAMAVAGGMSEDDAQAKLDQEINDEYERVQDKFADAQRMAHSRDHVVRFNRSMKRTCERLARDDLAGEYFTRG